MSEARTGLIRHGDVMLRPVSNVPSYYQFKKADSSVIIARGEATGHAHLVKGENVETVTLGIREPSFIRVHGKAVLVHEKEGQLTGEHATVEIPEGTYEIVQQREFWGPGHERQVRD